MTDPLKPKLTESRRTAAISSGEFVSGSVFRLVREIRGSAYSVGDQFMLIDGEDCHNPNTLVLGGVGETYFIDPQGKPLKINAGDSQIDSIFEFVETEIQPQEIIEEISEEDAPTRHVTEGEFRVFRQGLADVLREIANKRISGVERGERGSRGFTGVQGEKGDTGVQGEKGDTGLQGLQGEKGERGEKGDTGLQGLQGEKGERGEKGDTGLQGLQGLQGERGERGEKGERGERGERGEKGDSGPQGLRGERGVTGAAGTNGRDGATGARGERGEKGESGAAGAVGKAGAKGAKGEKGDRGNTGESGVVTAKFPLVYDVLEKSIAIDEGRLEKILKKITSGGNVSAADMGWLASTGGGGKIAVYKDGVKITPDVRGVDFTGSAIESVTKNGGKVTVKLVGGVSSVNGLTGDVRLTIAGAGGKVYYLNPSANGSVDGYHQLGKNSHGGGGTSATITLANANQWIFVDRFITDVNEPNQSFLPGGNWDIDCFLTSNAASNETKFYMDLWLYKQDGTTLSLGSSKSTPTFISDPTTLISYSNSVYVYPRILNSTDRIVILLYAATTKNQNHQVTAYYEDNTVSHIHTTFPSTVFPNYVSSFNGLTGDIEGISSVNGATGSVINVALTNVGNTFTVLQSFSSGISAAGGTFSGTQTFVNGATFQGNINAPNLVTSFNGKTGSVNFVGGYGITLSMSGSTYTASINYLYGGIGIPSEKRPSKEDWILLQSNVPSFDIYRSQISNLSYVMLGSPINTPTSLTSHSIKLASNINDNNSTVTEQYIGLPSFVSEISSMLTKIDGGTFA